MSCFVESISAIRYLLTVILLSHSVCVPLQHVLITTAWNVLMTWSNVRGVTLVIF